MVERVRGRGGWTASGRGSGSRCTYADARVRRLHHRARDRLGQWRSRPSRQPVRPGRDAGAVLDHVPAAHPGARRPLHAPRGRRRAHLWCYVGWLMGVDRRWLPFDERAGLRMMYQIGASSPAADGHSYALAASLVDLPLPHPLPPVPAAAPPLPVRAGPVAGHHAAGAGRGAGAASAGAPALVPAGPARRERPKHHVPRPLPGGPAGVQRLGERRLEQAAQRILDGEIPDVVALPD
ncbi:DUF2236 domain-containing protein [Rhodococcus hoagii]|nr:DUF2236 domain-containing protein [Prescottella equi]